MTAYLLNTFSPDAPIMYVLYAVLVAFVVAESVFYLVKSLRRAKAIGMDIDKLKRVITTAVSFSILPAIGIAIGVITLVGILGIAFPAIRLSVIGSLQYETQMANGAAEALSGSMSQMLEQGVTAKDFVTMAVVMTVSIMSGPILVFLFYKKLQPKMAKLGQKSAGSEEGEGGKKVSLGDLIFKIVFIGLVIGYLSMSITTVAQNPKSIASYYNLIACVIAALFMFLCDLLIEKKGWKWLDSFSTAFSMLIAMAVVAVLSYYANLLGWIPAETTDMIIGALV